MAKSKFDYDSYDLQLDADVRAEVAGTRDRLDGPVIDYRNQNPWFDPLGRALVGVWRLVKQANKSVDNAFGNAVGGERPGERLLVDTKRRHVKVIHRLTLPENAGKLAALKELGKTDDYRHLKLGAEESPKDVDIGPLSDQDWVHWLYWMRRLVDRGDLQIIKGETLLPRMEEIRRMGDIRLGAGVYFGEKNEEFWKLPKVTEKETEKVGA